MRVYGVDEETGKRVLLRLRCDSCEATIKPHPDIAKSGWVNSGIVTSTGERLEFDRCPVHAP